MQTEQELYYIKKNLNEIYMYTTENSCQSRFSKSSKSNYNEDSLRTFVRFKTMVLV